MKKIIDPGTAKKTLTLKDNIVYSVRPDLSGNPIELKMSILLQNGNSEMRAAYNEDDPTEDHSPKPALVWIPGGGWRGVDKNLMIGEMSEFANAGYVVASIYYRSTDEGHFPAQLVDVKTAIRFLRAHAAEYEIDPEHIGVFGRSAGGHLSVFAAMNLDGYDDDVWSGYSSKVSCAVDMFGPVNVTALVDRETKKFSDPSFRWHSPEETHWGKLLGGDTATMRERSKDVSPVNFVNPGMAPIQIFHGDNDPLVPKELTSDVLYQRCVDAGLEDRVEYYVVKHAGHGSREFFQPETKELMIQFFDRYMK